ncbi:MAG: hypothetical protein IJ222_04650 [Bacteroidales bacterium]|nr:hypothetical protein [Bacteroidales bacterium]
MAAPRPYGACFFEHYALVPSRGRTGHDHFTGHSSFSTFRISLRCLMGFPLIHRNRVPDGKHYRFTQENEAELSRWMKENLIVYHKPSMYYEDIETDYLPH